MSRIQNIETGQYLAIKPDDRIGNTLQTVEDFDVAGLFSYNEVEGKVVIKAASEHRLTVAAPKTIVPEESTLVWKDSDYIWIVVPAVGPHGTVHIRVIDQEIYWSNTSIVNPTHPPPPTLVLQPLHSGETRWGFRWLIIPTN